MNSCRIVAIGGGGFSDWGDSGFLDDYLLGLTGKPKPKVCFLATASGDSAQYITQFYIHFPVGRAIASHVGLFHYSVRDPRSHIMGQDIIYVGGGSTVNLLAIWRAHGMDSTLRDAWRQGVILAGISAGALCWFESGITLSSGHAEPIGNCLGFLPGSFCPHYRSQPEVGRQFRQMVATGELPAGLALDDGAAACFTGEELTEVVTQVPGATGYVIRESKGQPEQTALPARSVRPVPADGG